MSDVSVPCEHKSQTTNDQKSLYYQVKNSSLTNHCIFRTDCYTENEDKTDNQTQITANGMEDSGGGGTVVKKKRRKKEPNDREAALKETAEDSKPKKKRERKELRYSSEPNKVKEPKQLREPKKSRKQRDAKQQINNKSIREHVPKTKKSKAEGLPLVEKRTKRKREILDENSESENSLLSPAGYSAEESIESFESQKRRSGRHVKRRKYNEDLDFKVVDDDGETVGVLGSGRASSLSTSLAWQAEEPPEDDANIIERILTSRMIPKECHPGERAEQVEEFYVKYRNFSYLHCRWVTMEELEKDPRIQQKIKRFRNKQTQMKHLFTEPDEALFNPDYVEVDRILEVAHTEDSDTAEEVTHYLVKWCSLSYEESTWELEEDVDPLKIREFEELQVLPEILHMERPSPEKWQKLAKSREYKNNNQLREYQLEGMNWLLFNWYNRKNCILADEMGLGKTIQSITFLTEIFLMGIRGPFLIIAPLSTITNWEREFRTWTQMNAVVYHGSQISRQMIHQYEMHYRDLQGNTIDGIFKFQVIITTFEMILADCPELKKIMWSCVIIDEAHRLKNRNCKLLEGLNLMLLEHKILLTGTPLQNSVEELFSLLNFLEPTQFPSESNFLEEFGDLKTEEQVKKLQSILKPMMLRRLKDDVEKNLAPKQETIIEVELTNIQKKYYRAILEKNFTFLTKGPNQHNMPNLINTMMELRKCCNHPYLINGAEEKILDDFRKSHSPEAVDFQLQAMIQAAGKLVLIDKLLPKLIAGGHKVLVFSQMVRCLDILEDYLIQRRYTYERIDGRVRGNLRQAAIDRFCKPDSDRFVFLLCTRAGGLGINLTAADTCIIFDSDWNPQNDLQAQARCHRIGQSKAVKVYRLLTRNSYEREMFDKASLKLGLDKAVLQDINRKSSTNGVQQLSKLEVEDLLRKGAYGALMDEEDEGSKFCEEDIDQILQRRTQTITIQSEGNGSTFAKASFVSSGNRTDISLDDPNFWQKWAKIAELEMESKYEKESLVIDQPRVRRQTKHYNSFEDDELMEFSELESDAEERPTRSRRLNEKTRRYLRTECFRVEKNLLIFGWGRWKDILTLGRFKWHLNEKDMEMICRALLVYCVKHYKGDEKIKSFIWDLITPTKDGQNQALQNHSGLSAPVPRGRKGRKAKNQLLLPEIKKADWLMRCNPEIVLHDDSYKKHLKQHCNKVLLRVRMLYYLKAEVLGAAADKALNGILARDLEMVLPDVDYVEIPVDWWDAEADKSLLVGVYKHGYERYNAMRADPALCFLEKVGMPNEISLSVDGIHDIMPDMAYSAILEKEDFIEDRLDPYVEQPDVNEDNLENCGKFILKSEDSHAGLDGSDPNRYQWPVSSALTARLRRLITLYQRCNRKETPRAAILVPSNHSFWLQEDMYRRALEMEPITKEIQKRWTRREQADFYRTVSSFGVVFEQEKKCFDWTQFRAISRLEKKTDESIENYFHSFVAMCRNVCRLPLRKDDGSPDSNISLDPITEERAARTLYRIELLRKVREQVLKHPNLHERLKLCHPSLYLPVWWECGKHDQDLLVGTAKHGLSRTDHYIMNDPQLSFLDAYQNYSQHKKIGTQGDERLCCHYQSSSKLYGSPACILERTCESIGNESMPIKMENSSNPIDIDKCSSEDVACKPYNSQIQDYMSSNNNDNLLSGSLMCMRFEKKTNCTIRDKSNDEQRPLDSEQQNSSEVGNDMAVDVLYEMDNEQTPYHCEADSMLGTCYLSSMDAECKQIDNQEQHAPFPITQISIHSSPSSESLLHEGTELENVDLLKEKDLFEPSIPIIPSKVPSTDVFLALYQDQHLEKKQVLSQHNDKSYRKTNVMEDLKDFSELVHHNGTTPPIHLGEEEFDSNAEKNRVIDMEHLNDGLICEDEQKENGVDPTLKTTDHLKENRSALKYTLQRRSGCVLSEFLKNESIDVKKESLEDVPETESGVNHDSGNGSMQKGGKVHCQYKEEVRNGDGQYQENCPEEEAKCFMRAPSGGKQENFQYARTPTIAQLLQEKTLYSFSEWPKDRVIINRIDNICHAVLKGKWPSSSQQFEAQNMTPTSVLASSMANRNSFSGQKMQECNLSNDSSVAHKRKENLLPPVCLEDERKPRQNFENKREDAKYGSLEQQDATHRRSPGSMSDWQEPAVDLPRVSEPSTFVPAFSTSTTKSGSMNSMPSSPGMDLSGILQAGLIHPVTGQIVNGSLRRNDAASRRRRGRRKNVEDMDLIFLKDRNFQTSVLGLRDDYQQTNQSTSHLNGSLTAPSSSQSVTASSVPTDQTGPSKSLLDWLRQQSDYTMDIPGFASSFSDKPRQRRQRCKDPSKLDVNTLTGEERVPVINRGTGRRLGGAMAPALKELQRWLDTNLEYAVAADWADIVRLSGFLPENKFNRILTEPVLHEVGQRRRGRHPRSEYTKTSRVMPDTSSGMSPLFMNGLIAGMDLVGLQNMRNMQGISLAGLVGFPTGFAAVSSREDVKNSLNMIPMMLPSMATVPQMFGIGGLLSPPMTSTCTSTVPTSTSTTTCSISHPDEAIEDNQSSQDSKKDSSNGKRAPTTFSGHSEPTVTTSNTVAFNPFLMPGMSHSLLYPSMFFSHGIGMSLPAMQHSRSLNSEAARLENQRRRKKKVKAQSLNARPETAVLTENTDQEKGTASGQNCTDSTTPSSREKETGVEADENDVNETQNLNF
ncbi:chromodomain-helicase-DNA-binding protein 6 isoform X2 [Ambystoma mexicanum]|uniref:chromodomain-helicase-DNA-binding protein 6 isoform X2 n=1 Tax=Ambystoma mexicanum TaxID=8296 RepID=UPI0037E79C8B